ncbi:hypothetical protein BDV96DRAFT_563407 [Lophiotrema nucula]|uniref:TNFR-Cys domain-containing protein n=1 Tax=Lophiotrema nucula TaxID=690887 RepID=A0A6A5ZSB8_9PLEO|nr:hypothetical protein BDV96DRAFT_563407 [Lophiotrema nucula]
MKLLRLLLLLPLAAAVVVREGRVEALKPSTFAAAAGPDDSLKETLLGHCPNAGCDHKMIECITGYMPFHTVPEAQSFCAKKVCKQGCSDCPFCTSKLSPKSPPTMRVPLPDACQQGCNNEFHACASGLPPTQPDAEQVCANKICHKLGCQQCGFCSPDTSFDDKSGMISRQETASESTSEGWCQRDDPEAMPCCDEC